MAERIKMRTIPLADRKTSFDEVTCGYNLEEAKFEASRCLNCKNHPCVSACPVSINIPKFIMEINNGLIDKAKMTILEKSLFGDICGRVCPQEKQCEAVCVRAIKGKSVAIGNLERFVFDESKWFSDKSIAKNKYSVGIVGSGPAGLACAYELALNGFNVEIYEALHVAGGVLTYGIPEFRLPKELIYSLVTKLEKMGVIFNYNVVVGKTIYLNELEKKHDALFLGTGAGLPRFMNIKGEMLNGVMSANEFLTRVNLMRAYKDDYDTPLREQKIVAVVGGGNVAMDAARSAIRLGAKEVHLIYRRSFDEMPARLEEVKHAQEEGVIFDLQSSPIEILGNENHEVVAIKCIKTKLGDKDESGRRSFEFLNDCIIVLEVDTVIMALGNYPNPLLQKQKSNIIFNKWGCIVVDENNQTSKKMIYAGGDAVTGAATVILAMGAGQKAANDIKNKLK
ncbi:MAG TPA: NADPH-dependent glutamate synthase [Acholeplasmataceae bacterium]|nr:NADPH-dependent glutamate synthase [Acholeplasmataceae bacterium]